ncbi:RNA polymerase II subunit A C-terminal domain phosphatase SSU72 [Nibea albiflora]|uniref:RNA polymerase II subunit A C-terminal domain phosphatase SSU72 n=1 Tax=Nibea albiflora TaxID=240163 RepID=A0ACB7F010_NIBAL|nr:RNA polymerase II subunit A C-terminal domain phosphatase SSU72 [Nibea albiflora]
MPSHPLRVAVVCSSNQNRSMEAHNILSKRGFDVRSFGTGSHVKLPGPAPDKPNVYDFKTTYVQMYNDLVRKDKELYTQNGILHMLDRNKRIKSKPERFQNCKDKFDLVVTCEERVYDQVLEDLNSREQETLQPVHVINVDIQDNHEEATLGAFLICELCQCFRLHVAEKHDAVQLSGTLQRKSTDILLMAMNALLHSFQNIIVLLIQGEDGVCDCMCGRHQVHHVIPFDETQHMVAYEENSVLANMMTQKQMCVMSGVIFGLCISWFFHWLERARLKYWR